jgi:hypothetical protein
MLDYFAPKFAPREIFAKIARLSQKQPTFGLRYSRPTGAI